MNKQKTKKIIISAMLAALCFVATIIIQIPTPSKGYVNLGDTVVIITGWILGPAYGMAASGIGSALADFSAGYYTYAPATFIIKTLMTAGAFYTNKFFSRFLPNIFARIFSAIIAELLMATLYMVYEWVFYRSLATAIVGIPGNLVQGVAGVIGSVILYEAIVKRIPKIETLRP